MKLLLRCARQCAVTAIIAAAGLQVSFAQVPVASSPLAAFPPVVSAFPSPLLNRGKAVEWWFAFKLNAKVFPGCTKQQEATDCRFGGTQQSYQAGRQFVFATSDNPALQKSDACIGGAPDEPLGATFDEIYNGALYYVVWNDQFYGDPKIAGCGDSCSGPWGHSKGVLAWNDAGEGFVVQVTTPSWPASGSRNYPRKSDGNSLGCVRDDNVKVSQHFFALRLSRDDVVAVLQALRNASVVTDPANPQVVRNGGPPAIQGVVRSLGVRSDSHSVIRVRLSSGVGLVSKPSALHVPPWQLVSSQLGGVALRTATWWATPRIESTKGGDLVGCWSPELPPPGPVEIAVSGTWNGSSFGLKGGPGADFNHAKIGVTTSGPYRLAIFGDLNQQGTLSGPNCGSSQNGRGGLFYIVENGPLADGISQLISGEAAQ